MHPRSMAKDLSSTVKEILGTCVFVGCTVNGTDPKDLQQEISDGEVEVPLEFRYFSKLSGKLRNLDSCDGVYLSYLFSNQDNPICFEKDSDF
ncbi:hypothetical protein ZIOFF_069936 [Zingiber officinale]|uniref:Uncharacterized protein n=1 Tax=Zingiber officinale TaxID=94328 RepID=A0A8J5CDW7_ZINOF|nr:hypothetical protein ZIOFF_069936 [Zingiber officinale]